MTDDPARIRQVLRDHGYDVPVKGNISAAHRALYDQIMAGERDADYADGTSADDFAREDEPTEEQIRQAQQERKPKRPGGRGKARAAGDAARQAGGWWQRNRAGKSKVKRPKHPRVPVTDLVAKAWDWLGDMSEPISLPASRTFKLQSPVAGLILEDTIRDTFVDRALQPFARWQGKGKAIVAMCAPVLVLEIERAQGIANPQLRAVRVATLTKMLEQSMMLWQEVAGDKFEEAAERLEEQRRDLADVRRLIKEVIFAPAGDGDLCAEVIALMRDGTPVTCARPRLHDGQHAPSEDQAAAYAQQFAGASA